MQRGHMLCKSKNNIKLNNRVIFKLILFINEELILFIFIIIC